MGHSVGDAAARSVKKSEKAAAVANRTTEQRVADIRKLAVSDLAVHNADVLFLLDEYQKTLGIFGDYEVTVPNRQAALEVWNAVINERNDLREEKKTRRQLAGNHYVDLDDRGWPKSNT